MAELSAISVVAATVATAAANPDAATLVNICIAPMVDNPKDYLPFNLCHVPVYTNNQLCYYQTTRALLNADKAKLRNQMMECKNALELVNWDGNT
jgi:hypothetical protein